MGSNLKAEGADDDFLGGYPVPQSKETMTEAELDVFIRDIMELLIKLEDLSDLETLRRTAKALSEVSIKCKRHKQYVANQLIKMNYPYIVTKMLEKLIKMKPAAAEDTLLHFYKTIENYSDISCAFASGFASAGLPRLLKYNIAHKPYLENIENINVNSLLITTVSIIHNIVRNPNNAYHFNEQSVKNILGSWLTNGNKLIHCLAVLCLAYLVNEEETEMLIKGSNSIKYLVEWLDHALHNSGEERRCFYFTPEEIASALDALAVNDRMKQTIVMEGTVAHLVEMANGSRKGEINAALHALLNLSFDERIMHRLISEYEVENLARRLSSYKDKAVRISAITILWMIERSRIADVEMNALKRVDTKPYVFISYSWVDRQMVLKVRNCLCEASIECWMDVEQMHQSTLESMAKGIEGCRAMMLCMSESYKRSENCRIEATYGQQLRRPLVPLLMKSDYKPDGYLGILLGDNLYFDFGGRQPFTSEMDKLVRELRLVLDVGDHVDLPKPDQAPETTSWTTEDVAAWLDRCCLGHVKPLMARVDGRLLQQMAKLRRDSPAFFYQALKTELGFTFLDSLRFNNELDKLKL